MPLGRLVSLLPLPEKRRGTNKRQRRDKGKTKARQSYHKTTTRQPQDNHKTTTRQEKIMVRGRQQDKKIGNISEIPQGRKEREKDQETRSGLGLECVRIGDVNKTRQRQER